MPTVVAWSSRSLPLLILPALGGETSIKQPTGLFYLRFPLVPGSGAVEAAGSTANIRAKQKAGECLLSVLVGVTGFEPAASWSRNNGYPFYGGEYRSISCVLRRILWVKWSILEDRFISLRRVVEFLLNYWQEISPYYDFAMYHCR